MYLTNFDKWKCVPFFASTDSTSGLSFSFSAIDTDTHKIKSRHPNKLRLVLFKNPTAILNKIVNSNAETKIAIHCKVARLSER